MPYSLSGDAWPVPKLITLSFVPDGTDLGGVSSNLFAAFNAHRGWTTSTWEYQILKAAQQWAPQTNINFAVISDNGVGIGGGMYQKFGVMEDYWKATGSQPMDKGRVDVTKDPADLYVFRVASLRNVAMKSAIK